MKGKKHNKKWWILGGIGMGIIISAGVYALVTHYNEAKNRDPRSTQVNELIKEAEQLLELGRRGVYFSRRTRG